MKCHVILGGFLILNHLLGVTSRHMTIVLPFTQSICFRLSTALVSVCRFQNTNMQKTIFFTAVSKKHVQNTFANKMHQIEVQKRNKTHRLDRKNMRNTFSDPTSKNSSENKKKRCTTNHSLSLSLRISHPSKKNAKTSHHVLFQHPTKQPFVFFTRRRWFLRFLTRRKIRASRMRPMQLAVPSPANKGWDLFWLAPRNPRF